MLFFTEAKFTLAKLGKNRQYMGAYVKHFDETELGFRDLIAEDVLVDICLDGMIEGSRVHLENLSLGFATNGYET